MWLSLLVGSACVLTALYLLLAEHAAQQQSSRRGRYRTPPDDSLADWLLAGLRRLPALLIGFPLYGCYLLLKWLAAGLLTSARWVWRLPWWRIPGFLKEATAALGTAAYAAVLRVRRRRSARQERRRIPQQPAQKEEPILTEETIRAIQKQGLLRYLKGK